LNIENNSLRNIGSNIYSSLWNCFQENPFTFKEAKEKIPQLNSNQINDLKKEQLLFAFNKSEKESAFRLVPQIVFNFKKKYNIDLSWLNQGLYASLIFKLCAALKERFNNELLSIGIYGSISRNSAKLESDLDLFLVFRELTEGMNNRLKLLIEIENKKCVQEELNFLYERKIFPAVNYYFRKNSQLSINFFTIGIAFDLKILYDTGVLKSFLSKINKKIKDHNIQRKYLENSKYYLDLNIKFGDVFEFE